MSFLNLPAAAKSMLRTKPERLLVLSRCCCSFGRQTKGMAVCKGRPLVAGRPQPGTRQRLVLRRTENNTWPLR